VDHGIAFNPMMVLQYGGDQGAEQARQCDSYDSLIISDRAPEDRKSYCRQFKYNHISGRSGSSIALFLRSLLSNRWNRVSVHFYFTEFKRVSFYQQDRKLLLIFGLTTRMPVKFCPIQSSSSSVIRQRRLANNHHSQNQKIGTGFLRVAQKMSVASLRGKVSLGWMVAKHRILWALDGDNKTRYMMTPQLSVYLAAGMPFQGGTLGDFCGMVTSVKQFLYVVVTRRIPGVLLKTEFEELTDATNADGSLLLSLVIPSNNVTLSNIAYLLGYFNHDEFRGDAFVKVIPVAPLIC
jgi:hypothetical protein